MTDLYIRPALHPVWAALFLGHKFPICSLVAPCNGRALLGSSWPSVWTGSHTQDTSGGDACLGRGKEDADSQP